MQRAEAATRNNEGLDWHPKLFRRVNGGHGGSEEGEEDLDWIINAKVYVVLGAFEVFSLTFEGTEKHRRNKSSRFSKSQPYSPAKPLNANSASPHDPIASSAFQRGKKRPKCLRLSMRSPNKVPSTSCRYNHLSTCCLRRDPRMICPGSDLRTNCPNSDPRTT